LLFDFLQLISNIARQLSLDNSWNFLLKVFEFASNRLTVRSGFDSNFRNRPNLSISILEIDSKLDSISIILKSTWFDLTRFSISKLEIELNCQEC